MKDTAQREIQHIKKGMSQHKGLTEDQINTINEAIAKAEKALGSATKQEEVDAAVKEMKDVSGKIFTAAYSASASNSGASE